jgi:hypothetical protein
LVNSVPIILKHIIIGCVAFAKNAAACLRLTRAPALVAATAHVVAGTSAALPTAPLSADAQWQRVTMIVERSVERAHGIGEQQSAARQQLDAAEYTLHRLIEELNEVMTLPVQLPKRAEVVAPAQEQVFVQALAA